MRLRISIFLTMVFSGMFVQAFPAYYDISQRAQAQAEARQRGLPLAWEGGYKGDLEDLSRNRQASLEQNIVSILRPSAVVIFFDGQDMGPVPNLVHMQFHIHDDGELSGGASWLVPKVVFTNPEVTKILGRVSATQMRQGPAAPLAAALRAIQYDPTALALPTPTPPPPPYVEHDVPDPDEVAAQNKTTRGRLFVCGIILLLGFLWWCGRKR